MNSKKSKTKESCLTQPNIAILIFAIAFFVIFVSGFFYPDWFEKHAITVLILVTLVYVYFTQKLSHLAGISNPKPYIALKFILVNDLVDFEKKYRAKINSTDKFKEIMKECVDKEAFKKNLVFVSVRNIGHTSAVEIEVNLSYEKKDAGDITNSTKTTRIPVLQMGEETVELIEVFDSPIQADHLNIKKCETICKDINSTEPYQKDLSESVRCVNHDKRILVNFGYK